MISCFGVAERSAPSWLTWTPTRLSTFCRTDRQAETASTWMAAHSEITHVSRDRGAEYASAASTGAPQAIQVADRFHVCRTCQMQCNGS
ncbi:transposase [Reticulibacter mediterranei]|uniref:transposase n=1 Tax=Reticulibacter mediterranei TaxID=2778369 RepID=UPI001C68D80A|nr:transposase [Reticulibacter mediterranei]